MITTAKKANYFKSPYNLLKNCFLCSMKTKELLADYLDELDWDLAEKGENLYNKKGKQIVVKKLTTDDAVLIVPSQSSQQQMLPALFEYQSLCYEYLLYKLLTPVNRGNL